MSASSLSRLVAILLLMLGFASVFGRFQARRQAGRAVDDSIWRLTYNVRFKAIEDGVVLRLAIPQDSTRAKLLNEEFVHSGLESIVLVGQETGTRRLELMAPHTGDFQAQAEFEIQLSTDQSSINRIQESLTGEARSRFLRNEPTRLHTQDPAVQDVVSMVPKDATDGEMLQIFFDYCAQSIRPTTADDGGDDVDRALGAKIATPLGRARAFATLCRAVRMPARLVTGFELRQSRSAQPHVWVEVFRGNHWLPFDPEYGYARRMPSGFLPIQRGGEGLVPSNLRGITDINATYAITRLPPPEEVLLADMRHPIQILDLTRLPVEMHKVMSLMLLLPLGALVTSIFRNLVGIQTFGTFAPALLAVSFIYADWGTGLLVLIVVMSAGIAGRSLLERLHLLMVPRLSIILTTIIVCVLFGVSFLDYMELTPSAQAVLLPLVILTILIERMYVVAEEDGPAFTLQLALGTIVVAACCYLLLRWDEVGRIMLVYPELHCFTVAAFIGIGRYTGYRLTELWRFRDLTAETDELV